VNGASIARRDIVLDSRFAKNGPAAVKGDGRMWVISGPEVPDDPLHRQNVDRSTLTGYFRGERLFFGLD
jgi:hypothetical protein